MKITLNQAPPHNEKSAYKLADEKLDAWVDAGEYDLALELLQSLKTSALHRNADNYDYRIWIFNQLNQFDNKMAELLEAAQNNVFFPLDVEGYFNGIQQHAEFESLRHKNRLALDKLAGMVEAEIVLYTPNGKTNGELLLILHGNAQFNESITEQWPPSPYLDLGFTVAYLQSPKLFCTDGYHWTDHYSDNRQTLKQAFELIKTHTNIDSKNISLAGFSGGAMVSISAVTHGVIKPKQLLAFLPHHGDYVGNIHCENVPMSIFKAEFDANIDALFAALKPHANAKLTLLEGLDHALPADMASYVLPHLQQPN